MRELGSRIHGRGSLWCFFHVPGLSVSEARDGKGEGKSLGSLAAAGHSCGGVHASMAAAVLRLCLRSTESGGRAASAANMVTGVVEKQFVAHLRDLFQKTSSLWDIAPLGTNRSAPYATTGSSKDETSRRVWRVDRQAPVGDSLLITAKAPCAWASLLEK